MNRIRTGIGAVAIATLIAWISATAIGVIKVKAQLDRFAPELAYSDPVWVGGFFEAAYDGMLTAFAVLIAGTTLQALRDIRGGDWSRWVYFPIAIPLLAAAIQNSRTSLMLCLPHESCATPETGGGPGQFLVVAVALLAACAQAAMQTPPKTGAASPSEDPQR